MFWLGLGFFLFLFFLNTGGIRIESILLAQVVIPPLKKMTQNMLYFCWNARKRGYFCGEVASVEFFVCIHACWRGKHKVRPTLVGTFLADCYPVSSLRVPLPKYFRVYVTNCSQPIFNVVYVYCVCAYEHVSKQTEIDTNTYLDSYTRHVFKKLGRYKDTYCVNTLKHVCVCVGSYRKVWVHACVAVAVFCQVWSVRMWNVGKK